MRIWYKIGDYIGSIRCNLDDFIDDVKIILKNNLAETFSKTDAVKIKIRDKDGLLLDSRTQLRSITNSYTTEVLLNVDEPTLPVSVQSNNNIQSIALFYLFY
mmetsp:Transcript_11807/g.10693  ORF Transcript_11807/g.10693 Transcript_11807/m.10693 type:complete len:102 (+) Transcript_11807:35-340(+)